MHRGSCRRCGSCLSRGSCRTGAHVAGAAAVSTGAHVAPGLMTPLLNRGSCRTGAHVALPMEEWWQEAMICVVSLSIIVTCVQLKKISQASYNVPTVQCFRIIICQPLAGRKQASCALILWRYEGATRFPALHTYIVGLANRVAAKHFRDRPNFLRHRPTLQGDHPYCF